MCSLGSDLKHRMSGMMTNHQFFARLPDIRLHAYI